MLWSNPSSVHAT